LKSFIAARPDKTGGMGIDEDNEERRRAVALFRETLLEDLSDSGLLRGAISARLREIAANPVVLPDGAERRFSERTLWSWWSAYRKKGLEGLLPAERSDKGVPREITPELVAAAVEKRREVPSRSTRTIIDILERQGIAAKGRLHRSTLDRHLELAGQSRRRLRTLGDKRFIRMLFERPNQLWVGDYHEAPILLDPRTESFRTVHLCVFIDHYSKYVPHGQWYANALLSKTSFEKSGIPNVRRLENEMCRSDLFRVKLDSSNNPIPEEARPCKSFVASSPSCCNSSLASSSRRPFENTELITP
jgi:hypothetical protein